MAMEEVEDKEEAREVVVKKESEQATDDRNEDAEEARDTEIEEVVVKERKQAKERGNEAERAAQLYISMYAILHSQARLLKLPDNTLYSGFVCMPMIAMSSNYSLTMTAISVKMVFLTIACIALQGGLVASLFEARVLLTGLDGDPSLCTYGQDTGTDRRPSGPSGQVFERSFVNVETDYTMVIVRNTLYEVMKKVGVNNDGIGPVEYGMQSSTCRFISSAVFCVAMCGEVFSMYGMGHFLWKTPSLSCCPKRPKHGGYSKMKTDKWEWVEFEDSPDNAETRKNWELIGKSKLDHITFKCNGVTYFWKFWSCVILLARTIIVFFTFWNGLFFLMNTGGIMEQILNSLALVFIVDLDRLMFATLVQDITKDIMQRLQPNVVKPPKGHVPLKEAMEDNKKRESHWSFGSFEGIGRFIGKFFWINRCSAILILVTVGGHYAYFSKHCRMQVAPLHFTEWFTGTYATGRRTRFFGGWEFVFGSWVSEPTLDRFSSNITCVPAENDLNGDLITKPKGCGLPTPWEVTPK